MSADTLQFDAFAALGRDQAESIAATLATIDPSRTLGYSAETHARA